MNRPEARSKLDAYAAAVRSADWRNRMGRWSMYAAAAGAALASATSAEASNIQYGYSGDHAGPIATSVFGNAGAAIGIGSLAVSVRRNPANAQGQVLFGWHGQTDVFTAGNNPVNFALRSSITTNLPKVHRSHGTARWLYLRSSVIPAGIGAFARSVTGIAGFQFAGGPLNGDIGWVQLKWEAGPGGFPDFVEALSYAYNTTPGAPIQAGYTGNGFVPEPGTLPMSLLALGAAGVLAWRRKRAATALA